MAPSQESSPRTSKTTGRCSSLSSSSRCNESSQDAQDHPQFRGFFSEAGGEILRFRRCSTTSGQAEPTDDLLVTTRSC
jgi:hypothetical protein